jgi:hypothetical protein
VSDAGGDRGGGRVVRHLERPLVVHLRELEYHRVDAGVRGVQRRSVEEVGT